MKKKIGLGLLLDCFLWLPWSVNQIYVAWCQGGQSAVLSSVRIFDWRGEFLAWGLMASSNGIEKDIKHLANHFFEKLPSIPNELFFNLEQYDHRDSCSRTRPLAFLD